MTKTFTYKLVGGLILECDAVKLPEYGYEVIEVRVKSTGDTIPIDFISDGMLRLLDEASNEVSDE